MVADGGSKGGGQHRDGDGRADAGGSQLRRPGTLPQPADTPEGEDQQGRLLAHSRLMPLRFCYSKVLFTFTMNVEEIQFHHAFSELFSYMPYISVLNVTTVGFFFFF